MAEIDLDLSDLASTLANVGAALQPVNLVGDVMRHPGHYAARWGAIAMPFVAPAATVGILGEVQAFVGGPAFA